MVLHHVAQRAGLVVIAGTAFKPDGFGHRDLHMVDMGGVPQRLVKRIGKAQRHQVLHRFLAEIVVDAEDLLFLEDLADRVVELRAPMQIAADRLFDDDAGVLGDQLVIADLFGNIAEKRRSDGQIEGADAVLAFIEQLFQDVPALVGFGIDGNVEQPRAELVDFRRFELAAS